MNSPFADELCDKCWEKNKKEAPTKMSEDTFIKELSSENFDPGETISNLTGHEPIEVAEPNGFKNGKKCEWFDDMTKETNKNLNNLKIEKC